jgi:protein involved in polysaccharide export with SLBB domain
MGQVAGRCLNLSAAMLLGLCFTLPVAGQGQGQTPATATPQATTETMYGPVRLRSGSTPTSSANTPGGSPHSTGGPNTAITVPSQTIGAADRRSEDGLAPPKLDEFEIYVRQLARQDALTGDLRRFGIDIVTGPQSYSAPDHNAQVPADYLLAAGDELLINLWGSVDAEVRAVVDRTGRINIPRVGTIMVAGTRYAELPELLRVRVGQVFRNFQLSVSLGQLRSVRVYVTGFARSPGAYFVTSLSTIVNAMMRAGGPSAAGSYRHIELRRGRERVVIFDLYDLLIKGDKAADRIVQAEDVIHIGPVGPQIGMIGSVNKPAVYELRPNETVQDAIQMAGGFNAVADRSRLAVERLEDRNDKRVLQVGLPESAGLMLRNGDVLRAFSAVDSVLSIHRQNKRVRVDGEVARPGEFVLPPDSSITDALRAAGGLTPAAYVFGTEFTRESVRATQQGNYDRALRDLELEYTRVNTQRAISADEAAAQTAGSGAVARMLERLRSVKPSGRIVFQLDPQSNELPQLALEDGDRIYVPARPNTVGVFGSVFNVGTYLYSQGRSLDDFLRLAGGPTRGADTDSVFVIRANGSVVSTRQSGTWFRTGDIARVDAHPGDTIFVPEEVGKTSFVQAAKEWTQILYQFGLGAAAIKTLSN